MVAIVDDDDAIRTALRRLMRTIGYEATTFGSAEALLSSLEAAPPACMLTDIQMPGMSGLELASELDRLRPGLPIAVMTAYPRLARRDATPPAHAFTYMEKPLHDRLLETWLRENIGDPSAG